MGGKVSFRGIKRFSRNTLTRIEHSISGSIYSSIKIIAVQDEKGWDSPVSSVLTRLRTLKD
jgi:hypothetical protein